MSNKIFFVVFFVFFVVTGVYGQSSAELTKQRQKIDAEIADLQKIIRAKIQEKILSQNEVRALSRQIDLRETKINTISREVQLINKQINKNTGDITVLKVELEKMRKEYEKMILFAFRNKNGYSKMMFIFASKDFNQAFKRVKYLQQFTDARKVKVAEIEKTQKEIELKIAQLERDKASQNQLLKEQQSERNIIAKDRSQHQTELNKIVREERTFQTQLTKKQQEKKKLDAAIKSTIAREVAAREKLEADRRRRLAEAEAKRTGTTVAEAEKKIEVKTGSSVLNNTPEATKLSADFKSNKGRLPWPVAQGVIVRNYGRAVVERNVNEFYDYIRIRTNDGGSVKAIFDGSVLAVLQMGATSAVIVQHGEYMTAYSNLKSTSVKRGQKITTGTVVGIADTDPDVGYSYVDLTVNQGKSPLDPAQWIAR